MRGSGIRVSFAAPITEGAAGSSNSGLLDATIQQALSSAIAKRNVQGKALEDHFIRHVTPEDLNSPRRDAFRKVADLPAALQNACAKCRWGENQGCLMCNISKAWRYNAKATLWDALAKRSSGPR